MWIITCKIVHSKTSLTPADIVQDQVKLLTIATLILLYSRTSLSRTPLYLELPAISNWNPFPVDLPILFQVFFDWSVISNPHYLEPPLSRTFLCFAWLYEITGFYCRRIMIVEWSVHFKDTTGSKRPYSLIPHTTSFRFCLVNSVTFSTLDDTVMMPTCTTSRGNDQHWFGITTKWIQKRVGLVILTFAHFMADVTLSKVQNGLLITGLTPVPITPMILTSLSSPFSTSYDVYTT